MIPRLIGKRFSNDWKRFWHDSGVFRSGQEQRQLEVTSMQNLQKRFSTFQASAQTLTGRKSFVIEVTSVQDFGGSTAKFSPTFGGHRFAFARDDFGPRLENHVDSRQPNSVRDLAGILFRLPICRFLAFGERRHAVQN